MLYSVLAWPVILPVLFWAFYHYHKDERQPEPVGHLLVAFLLGVGSFYLAGFMYEALGLVGLRFDAFELAETNPLGLFVYAVLAIGSIEETAKMIPFLLVVIRFKEFNEPVDGVIYGSFIALGFAMLENVQYMHALNTYEAMARGFAGPVVHIVAFTAILHGLYDFLVLTMHPLTLPPAAVMVGAIWVWRLRLIKDLHAQAAGVCPGD
jgi:RsiW-degrading membrane proteinase PrsW (M82 family)